MSKKILSVLLAALMLFSVMPFALAEGEEGTPMTFKVASARVTYGEEFTLSVSTENNPGMSSFTFVFDYDKTCLELINIEQDFMNLPGYFYFSEETKDLVFGNAKNIASNGVIFTMSFKVLDSAKPGNHDVTFTWQEDGGLINRDDDNVPATVDKGTVEIYCEHTNKEDKAAVPATCVATGLTAGVYCPTCGTWLVEQTIIPVDTSKHDWGNWTKLDDNQHTRSCQREGCNATETVDHTWDNGEITTLATCQVDGIKTFNCTVCGATKEENLGKAEHTWVETANTATCTVPGQKTFTCSVCQQTKNEDSDPLGHTYGEPTWSWNEDHSVATATFTCVSQDDTKEVKDEAPGTVDVSAATCTADKVIKYTAEVTQNDTKYSTESDPVTVPNTAGHTYGDFVNPVPADCGNDGTLGYYQCSVCQKYFDADKKELESIVDPATGNHTPVPTVAQDATCTADGNNAYWTCSVCGKFFSDEACKAEITENSWVIGKLGHSFTNYVSDNNATCTEDGTKTAKCDRCEVTDTIADPGTKTGHTFGEWVVDVEATCEANGHRYRICEKDKFKEEEVIPATGHKDDDKDNICDVCSKDLTPENTCEYCGEVHEGLFGKITYFFHKLILKVKNMFGDFSVGHVHNYDAVVTPPTCEGYGYTTYTCKICGRVYIGDHTEPAGHSYDVWYTDVEATCTTEGHQYAVCTVCQQRAEQTIPTSAAHVDANGDGVCDICGKSEVCPYCGETHEGLLGGLYKLVHVLLYKLANLF